MSDEGGVTFSDVALDATLPRVTPGGGKGALGTWRFQVDSRTLSREWSHLEAGTSPGANRHGVGCTWAST
jgi:hypothetical protein